MCFEELLEFKVLRVTTLRRLFLDGIFACTRIHSPASGSASY